MPKVNGPTLKEKKLVKGLIEGKTQEAAGIEAGYTPSVARARISDIIARPRVQSFLTDALERLGVQPGDIVGPLADALKACKRVKIPFDNALLEVDAPDHATRLAAYDRVSALYGVIPREVEMPAPPRPAMVVVIRQAAPTGTPPPPKQINAPATIDAPPAKPNGKGNGHAAPARAPLVVTIKRSNGHA